MRIRTVWTWKLIAYPLIVIPLIVYFAAKGGDVDERASARYEVTGAAHPNNAAIHGFHKGRAITCVRHPKITHCVEWKQPETVIDR